MSLECDNIVFLNNDRYGIEVLNNSFINAISIKNCSIEASASHGIGGIFLERSAGNGESTNNIVSNNTILINKSTGVLAANIAHGILVTGINNGSDFMDIVNNNISIHANRNSIGCYINPVNGMDFMRIRNNTVIADSLALSAWGIGLVAGPTAGMHNTVYFNIINGTSQPTSLGNFDLYCGIHLQATANTHICDNTLGKVGHGFHGWAVNSNSDLTINNFDSASYVGLKIAAFSQIDIQPCHGNLFNGGMKFVWRGADNQSSPTINRFTIQSTVPNELPWNVNPTNWFISDTSCLTTTPTTCTNFIHSNPLEPEITELDERIADGTYTGDGGASYLFEARLQLYNRFFGYSSIYSSNTVIDSFMTNNVTSTIGKITIIDRTISRALNLPTGIVTNWNNNVNQIAEKLDSISRIDSLIAVSGGTSMSLFTNRQLKIDTLRILDSIMTVLNTSYINNRNQWLDSASVRVQSISASDSIEADAKTVRIIHILKLQNQNDTLTSSQITTLKAIASKCPDDAGSAVGYAAGLLASVGITDTSFVPDQSCIEEREGKLKKFKDKHQEITIFPNPSSGIISIQAKDLIKSIEVYNVSGILITRQIEVNSLKAEINIAQQGLIFVRTLLQNGQQHSQTITIIK